MNKNDPSGQAPENFFVRKEEVHTTDKNEPFYILYSINCNGETLYDITEDQFKILYDFMGKFITAKKEGGEK